MAESDWVDVDSNDWEDIPSQKTQQLQQKKPDLYSEWGMNITPEMEKDAPYLSAMAKTAQEGVVTPVLHFLNQAGLNAPRAMTKQGGYDYPEPTTLPGQVLAKGAGVAGAVFSPITRLILGLTGADKVMKAGIPLSQRVISGAAGGAGTGFAYTPTEDMVGLKQRSGQAITGAAIGAGTGLVGGAINKVSGLLKGPISNEAKFAEDIQKEFVKSKANVVEKFGEDLDNLSNANPDRTISLREQVVAINNDPYLSPEAQAVFRKTPILRDMLDNPNLADEVSLKDAQEISNYINTKVPKNIKYNHLDILDMASDIRAKQLEAFPELQDIRDAYRTFKSSYDIIKPAMKTGRTLQAIADNFGDAQMQKAAKTVFNDTVISQMKQYRDTLKMLKFAGFLGKHTAIGAATGLGAAGAGIAGYEAYKALRSK